VVDAYTSFPRPIARGYNGARTPERERAPVAEGAEKHRLGAQSICARRKRFGGLEAAGTKRLRPLEGEKSGSEELVADVEGYPASVCSRASRLSPRSS
jgi:hypothetical protein